MSDVVLDASALLALLGEEPGAIRVATTIPGALVSAANRSEVVGKLVDMGLDADEAAQVFVDLGLRTVPVDEHIADAAGALRAGTRALGLSLGDRLCIATAEVHGAAVLTADRAWAEVEAGVSIELIR
ncbi:MAG: type II toxin-antitoxin system VapC family toxin [Myxococcota bacterium]